MLGKLCVIAGFSCSGKTTLINTLQRDLGGTITRRDFYTNRPARSDNERSNSADYIFVSTEEYQELKKANQPNWHSARWYGHDYGFITTKEQADIRAGRLIVIGMPPNASYLTEMQDIHGKSNVISILINVRFEVMAQRLSQRPMHERDRIDAYNQAEIDVFSNRADIVFFPENILQADCKNFLEKFTEAIQL